MESALVFPTTLAAPPARRTAPVTAGEGLVAVVEAIVSLSRQAAAGTEAPGDALSGWIDELCASIIAWETAGCSREEIMQVVRPVFEIHLRSPFTHRLARWPRGYPGDFETVDYLFEARNQATPGTIEYYYEQYALNCPAAQQHRNKLRYQASLILDTFRTRKAPRILSLAAGSCRDLRLIQSALGSCDGQIVLNDTDPEALDAAREALRPIAHACHFSPGNPIRVARRLQSSGPFDLIVAGGLFDYLPAHHIACLITHAYAHLLKPEGRFFFTNIGSGNPFRPWMEYLGAWRLIERSEEEVLELCRSAGVAPDHVSLRRDETGLTILCEIVRAGSESASKSPARTRVRGLM